MESILLQQLQFHYRLTDWKRDPHQISTLRPLRWRNVAWRASRWAWWIGGADLKRGWTYPIQLLTVPHDPNITNALFNPHISPSPSHIYSHIYINTHIVRQEIYEDKRKKKFYQDNHLRSWMGLRVNACWGFGASICLYGRLCMFCMRLRCPS